MNQVEEAIFSTSHTDQILKIKENIKNWERIRKTSIGLSQLKSGFGFMIDISEYNYWLNTTKLGPKDDIHVYLGVNELDQFTFYLVDSITDHRGRNNNNSAYELNKNLYVKHFSNDLTSKSVPNLSFNADGELTPAEVMSRLLNWQLHSHAWHQNQMNSSFYTTITGGDGTDHMYAGVLKCMIISFKDLQQLFGSNSNATSALAFFALREAPPSSAPTAHDLEFILCSNTLGADGTTVVNSLADVTMPIPPYSAPARLNLF